MYYLNSAKIVPYNNVNAELKNIYPDVDLESSQTKKIDLSKRN